jgi:hypothetical protein
MGRSCEKPNPLRRCEICGNTLAVILTRGKPDGSIRRLKRCGLGHEITTFERLGIETTTPTTIAAAGASNLNS